MINFDPTLVVAMFTIVGAIFTATAKVKKWVQDAADESRANRAQMQTNTGSSIGHTVDSIGRKVDDLTAKVNELGVMAHDARSAAILATARLDQHIAAHGDRRKGRWI